MIKKRGRKYVLTTRDGSRVLGKHSTRAGAERQERAIKAAKAERATAAYEGLMRQKSEW